MAIDSDSWIVEASYTVDLTSNFRGNSFVATISVTVCTSGQELDSVLSDYDLIEFPGNQALDVILRITAEVLRLYGPRGSVAVEELRSLYREVVDNTLVPVLGSPPASWTGLQTLVGQGGAMTAAMITADGQLPKFLLTYGTYALIMSIEPVRTAVAESVANRIRRRIDPEGQAIATPPGQQGDVPPDAPDQPTA